MALYGNDLVVTKSGTSGASFGYVFPQGNEFGEPCVLFATAPRVPLGGASTPTNAPGGVYDVRDADNAKAISHLGWNEGAGQRSLDTADASPYMYYDSFNIDVQSEGRMSLLRDVVFEKEPGFTGPIHSFSEWLFAPRNDGQILWHLPELVNFWNISNFGTTMPTVPASCFTSDGVYVYMCIPSGAGQGVWRTIPTWNGVSAPTWNKLGSSNEAISKIAYHSGDIYAAVDYVDGVRDSQVALLNPSDSYHLSTTMKTPAIVKRCTTVALETVNNAVYWVVSQNGRSYVYRLYYDPTATTPVLSFEAAAEFPNGFVATCAAGYLSTLYVGGYFESQYDDVGMGSVYAVYEGMSAPLLTMGERPEHTFEPESLENDNRIYSICAGSKDIFFTTNRGCYRWDIDDGGYSHVFPLTGSGYGNTVQTWEDGTLYSWDGTSNYNANPYHQVFPSGWTQQGVETNWSFDAGVATLAPGTSFAVYCTPTGADEIGVGGVATKIGIVNGGLTVSIQDGTKFSMVGINAKTDTVTIPKYAPTYVLNHYEYWDWVDDGEGPVWTLISTDVWEPDGFYEWTWNQSVIEEDGRSFNGVTSTIIYAHPDTVMVRMLNGEVIVNVNDNAALSGSTSMLSPTSTKEVRFVFEPSVSIDYILLNSSEAVPSGFTKEVLNYSGMSYHLGSIFTALSVPSGSESRIITDISTNNPAVITTGTAHGFVTGDSIEISGSNINDVDGVWTITRLTDYTFTIPVSGNVGSSTGFAFYAGLCKEGVAYLGTNYAETGSLTQSETNFHSGSMQKDFRSVEVVHDFLDDTTLGCVAVIDGNTYSLSPTTGVGKTIFPLNKKGYSIKTTLTLNSNTEQSSTPVVKAVNVIWDFVKVKKHQYILDCRSGSYDGRWREDPKAAIQFLFQSADETATFEDQFSGAYEGIIEEVKFMKANRSIVENPSGIVALTVREA